MCNHQVIDFHVLKINKLEIMDHQFINVVYGSVVQMVLILTKVILIVSKVWKPIEVFVVFYYGTVHWCIIDQGQAMEQISNYSSKYL